MMSRVTLPCTFWETHRISVITANEPMMAAMEMTALPIIPVLLRATPPMLPDIKTTRATPSEAPLLIPSTEGPAKGLWKTVCIWRPLMASPAPATMAVIACGSRDLRMIFRHTSDCEVSPNSICIVSCKGIEMLPMAMFRKRNTTMSMMIKRNFQMRIILIPSVGNISGYSREVHQGRIL